MDIAWLITSELANQRAKSTIHLFGIYKLLLLLLLLLLSLLLLSSGGYTNTILNSIKIHSFIPIRCSNTWQISVLSLSIFKSTYGLIIDPHNDLLSVGLIAQLVEHCTGIAEVRICFVFSRVLMFHSTSSRDTSGLSGKQSLLSPSGPHIKCILREGRHKRNFTG